MTKQNNNQNINTEYLKIFVYGIITPSIIIFGLYYATNDILKNTFKSSLKDALKESFKESMSDKINDMLDNKSIKGILFDKLSI